MVLGNDGSAMSKSKGNVVDPGRDGRASTAPTPCRLFVLFAAPPEKDMPWIESSVGGPRRFLRARVPLRDAEYRARSRRGRSRRRTGARCASCIRPFTRSPTISINRWHFNTSIAALMELINTLYDEEANLSRAALDQILPALVLLLGPFAPYIAEELWEQLGRTGSGVPPAVAGVRRRAGERRRRRRRAAGQRQGARTHVGAVRDLPSRDRKTGPGRPQSAAVHRRQTGGEDHRGAG